MHLFNGIYNDNFLVEDESSLLLDTNYVLNNIYCYIFFYTQYDFKI